VEAVGAAGDQPQRRVDRLGAGVREPVAEGGEDAGAPRPQRARELSQLRDYAVLRALGLRARRALGLALAQVGATVAAGFLLALVLVWALAAILPSMTPTLVLPIRTGDVAQALGVAAAVALAAAAFPVLRVARIDPASVFRR